MGTAGWGIASRYAAEFPSPGSHLQRYAAVFEGVEITSSFARSHRRTTYQRWADSVTANFRFAVKTPRALTHEGKLALDAMPLFDQFVSEVTGLGDKLGVLLVQFPPSLAFDPNDAAVFFSALRQATPASVRMACEPRHATWACDDAEQCLQSLNISRVAADPPRFDADRRPGGSQRLVYFRLHGAPRIYYSNYETPQLDTLARQLEAYLATGAVVWCIFDNTANGHALDNALAISRI